MNRAFHKNIFNYLKIYYPYLIFFIAVLFLHLFMDVYGDDIYFSKVLSNWSLWEFSKFRFASWTSRTIIDAFCVIFAKNLLLWKILDSLIYTVGVYYLIKLVNKENNKKIVIFGILLFLMFPFTEMGTSVGWMASTLNYVWCFSLGMISFIPLINEYYNENTRNITYVISTLALFYATNHEQCCALILGFSLLYLINNIINKEKINEYNLVILIISCWALALILICPGTSSRSLLGILYYPQYASYGVLEKIYLGIVPAVGILLNDKLIFSIFYILLSVSALFKTKNKYLKFILYFNIIFILFIMLYKLLFDISMLQDAVTFTRVLGDKTWISIFLNGIKSVISIFSPLYNSMILFDYCGVPNKIDASVILTLFISLYLLVSSSLMLLKTYEGRIFPLIVFIAGFMSRFIMGFSSWVFSSSSRTSYFFYVILIMSILMLINKLYDENKINKKVEHLMIIIFSVFALLEYLFLFVLVYVML